MSSELSAAAVTPAALADRSARVAARLHEYLPVTPLVRFDVLSEDLGAEVLVKCDHLQRTGSFKARGALTKLLSLTQQQREHGVVTASTGNHGLGFANALAALGGRGIVFVPANAAATKIAALRRTGVEIRTRDTDAGAVELLARRYAEEQGLIYFSGYNDPDIIAGQGTAAIEILEQLAGTGLDTIFVNVGGGGLISGVAAVLKQHLPKIRVIGASPANDAGMIASIRAGHIVAVDAAPTLSEGSAGNVEPGSITFELCRDLVDEWVLVSEAEIGSALAMVIDTEHQLVEGAAGVAFAAARARRADIAGERVAIFSCGGNIAAATLATALAAP
ncbi:MAG TPA: threonine/serine dehydratase [Pseudonocardiaceae bacterium]|jgi:threonine dehydratase|nr:threonine/serine dehydratase [Pseudonocardiaceae bacterium]